ncbi:hypothetical protein FA379_05945 [Pseudomonas aeruginosa]|nr:hypothetical protein [Pseudomonas aeruginosa]MCO2232980.1 hypothetical protein [Pseudomonas aeruginosa]MCO2237937.1 hypothetical protein [Pseudomonas aeruginosa]MCO2333199.1 hypothetical protein [Pseudomonas aeruginosa]MCO2356140.1 hypothetical protein [Pseudomonas aeruginosa]
MATADHDYVKTGREIHHAPRPVQKQEFRKAGQYKDLANLNEDSWTKNSQFGWREQNGSTGLQKIKGKECLYLFRACVYYLAAPFLLISASSPVRA